MLQFLQMEVLSDAAELSLATAASGGEAPEDFMEASGEDWQTGTCSVYPPPLPPPHPPPLAALGYTRSCIHMAHTFLSSFVKHPGCGKQAVLLFKHNVFTTLAAVSVLTLMGWPICLSALLSFWC